MINDRKTVNPWNLVVQFAEDITRSVPITNINLKKTWKLLLRERSTRIPLEPLDMIDRKDKLTLLWVTFEENHELGHSLNTC